MADLWQKAIFANRLIPLRFVAENRDMPFDPLIYLTQSGSRRLQRANNVINEEQVRRQLLPVLIFALVAVATMFVVAGLVHFGVMRTSIAVHALECAVAAALVAILGPGLVIEGRAAFRRGLVARWRAVCDAATRRRVEEFKRAAHTAAAHFSSLARVVQAAAPRIAGRLAAICGFAADGGVNLVPRLAPQPTPACS